MRRLRLAAAAQLMAVILAILFASTGSAERAALSPGFPASRIKLDPASMNIDLPRLTANPAVKATLTATVVDWRGLPLRDVIVKLNVLSGPGAQRPGDKPVAQATTDATGRAQLSYPNRGGPGSDVVQATFVDGIETHKSNRPFVTWRSGPPLSVIPSPAALTVTPGCFQPPRAMATSSDFLTHPAPVEPKRSPSVARSEPPPVPLTINVDGVNFNPFTGVLISFDSGFGGQPESFQTRTDGFGHFNTDIRPTERGEGPYLIRADDFRRREAQSTYNVPCFQPSLSLNPPIGPPGFVTEAVATGFPPNSKVTVFGWEGPWLNGKLPKEITTDAAGAFKVPVLVLYHDGSGPRKLAARVPNPYGPNAGSPIDAQAPFLVTLGRAQPPDFILRR